MAQKTKETGLTFKTIENLKPLAATLKKLNITGGKLEAFLKEHQELEETGVTWENFKTIVRTMKK